MTNNIKPKAERKTFVFLIGRIALIKACLNCQIIADAPDTANCKVCGLKMLELRSTTEDFTTHQSLIAAYRKQADSLSKQADVANAFLEQHGLFGEYRVSAVVPDEFGHYGKTRTLVIFRRDVALNTIADKREAAILESVIDFVSR